VSAAGRRKMVVSTTIALTVLVAAVIIDIYLIRTRRSPEQIDVKPRPLRVRTVHVTPKDIVEYITGYGTARSMRTTNLTAEMPGTLVFRNEAARAGKTVRSGQILFKIDQRDYQHQIDQLSQQIKAQEAQLNQLELDRANFTNLLKIAQREEIIAADEYKRSADLFAKKTAAKRERDLAEAALQRARRMVQQNEHALASIEPRRQTLQANIRALETQLKQAKLNLQRCTVRAPFEGQIVRVNAEVGQTVQPGLVLAILTDPKRIEVPVELPASVRARLTLTAAAEIKPELDADAHWKGTVARIDANIDPTTRTFKAYVVVGNPHTPRPLVPGAFVQVSIVGPIYKSALVIPRTALRSSYVFVAKAGTARRRTIKLQRIIGETALIKTGLEPNDEVIITNLDILYDQAPIELANDQPPKTDQ